MTLAPFFCPISHFSSPPCGSLVFSPLQSGGEVATPRFTQYFHGSLSGLTIRPGRIETQKVISCLQACKEGLDINSLESLAKDIKVWKKWRQTYTRTHFRYLVGRIATANHLSSNITVINYFKRNKDKVSTAGTWQVFCFFLYPTPNSPPMLLMWADALTFCYPVTPLLPWL